ncbi:MAG: benzoate/H(+) symporter BenE family transporter [Desulfobacterales bacterium]|nr:benzoate/H(+) symporter BenE family transporter [Desulfobacterales bacterium]
MYKQLTRDMSLSGMAAGIIAVVVSFGGPAAIIFQAAETVDLDNARLISWIWAISIGSGVSGIYLSMKTKTPVITAWSTPGAALLVTGWSAFSYPEAIGCFVFSGALIMFTGVTRLFSSLMERIPRAVVAAMLAGILLRFGVDVFIHLNTAPLLVSPIIACFVLCKRLWPRYAIIITFVVGFFAAYFQGMLGDIGQVKASIAVPVFTVPEFSLRSLIGLGIPLFLVTMTGQNVTGLAVIRAAGYKAPANPMVTATGFASVVLAPFGAHGINLAAITAAICTGFEAHPDPGKRYPAGVICGLAYLCVGFLGATLVAVFMALPAPLISVIAGLALFGAIISGLSQAMAEKKQQDSALATFLITVSGVSFLGIGSAFWGILGGLLFNLIPARD